MSDDLIIWPNGTWCYRCDLHEFSFMSDDYQIIAEGSPKCKAFFDWLESKDDIEYGDLI